ncbi:transglycosylase SLT domain-containing protein [Methylococcus mesophilus]|uniref:transglycosylase SLT domain-containing protein n=1 Tax=Methylococcus mesophilus TaxID=2993564 RepID=UPI00224B5A0E|nr:transglycosylase SLT domain-containing protein [Methylococcus mesophilus]UZR29257.1 transglycosylase SLT domain-containing protein [Methylococcus mesophilus]
MLLRRATRLIGTLTFPPLLAACAHSLPPAGQHSMSHRDAESPSRKPDPDNPSYVRLPSDLALLQNRLASRLWEGDLPMEEESEAASAQGGKRRKARVTPGLRLARAMSGQPGKDGLWQHIRQKLVLGDIRHQAVDAEIESITHNPAHLDALARRGEPFLHYLASEIERKGLPMDVLVVPMVESAFDPQALSGRDAAGLWQIVRSTGEEHGLTVGENYDGRYDIHASTSAALSYLKHLSTVFKGDWLLALAAYNAGEGAVQRAVSASLKAGRGGSFWTLDLPAETRAYVPRILALSSIIANPEGYGLKLRKIQDKPYLARVEIDSKVRVSEVVAGSRLPEQEFFKMNPALKPGVQPPKRSYDVLLPVESAAVLASSLEGAKPATPRKSSGRRSATLSALPRTSKQG